MQFWPGLRRYCSYNSAWRWLLKINKRSRRCCAQSSVTINCESNFNRKCTRKLFIVKCLLSHAATSKWYRLSFTFVSFFKVVLSNTSYDENQHWCKNSNCAVFGLQTHVSHTSTVSTTLVRLVAIVRQSVRTPSDHQTPAGKKWMVWCLPLKQS